MVSQDAVTATNPAKIPLVRAWKSILNYCLTGLQIKVFTAKVVMPATAGAKIVFTTARLAYTPL